jgi:hypothetical protein
MDFNNLNLDHDSEKLGKYLAIPENTVVALLDSRAQILVCRCPHGESHCLNPKSFLAILGDFLHTPTSMSSHPLAPPIVAKIAIITILRKLCSCPFNPRRSFSPSNCDNHFCWTSSPLRVGFSPLALLSCCSVGQEELKPFNIKAYLKRTLYSPPIAHLVIIFLALALLRSEPHRIVFISKSLAACSGFDCRFPLIQSVAESSWYSQI